MQADNRRVEAGGAMRFAYCAPRGKYPSSWQESGEPSCVLSIMSVNHGGGDQQRPRDFHAFAAWIRPAAFCLGRTGLSGPVAVVSLRASQQRSTLIYGAFFIKPISPVCRYARRPHITSVLMQNHRNDLSARVAFEVQLRVDN